MSLSRMFIIDQLRNTLQLNIVLSFNPPFETITVLFTIAGVWPACGYDVKPSLSYSLICVPKSQRWNILSRTICFLEDLLCLAHNCLIQLCKVVKNGLQISTSLLHPHGLTQGFDLSSASLLFPVFVLSFFCGSFFIYVSCLSCFLVCSLLPRGHLLGMDWRLGSLVCDVFCVFVTFPSGVLGQVWYLIVSIPDLCLLTNFYYPRLAKMKPVHILISSPL